jgi:hypothetical protein
VHFYGRIPATGGLLAAEDILIDFLIEIVLGFTIQMWGGSISLTVKFARNKSLFGASWIIFRCSLFCKLCPGYRFIII